MFHSSTFTLELSACAIFGCFFVCSGIFGCFRLDHFILFLTNGKLAPRQENTQTFALCQILSLFEASQWSSLAPKCVILPLKELMCFFNWWTYRQHYAPMWTGTIDYNGDRNVECWSVSDEASNHSSVNRTLKWSSGQKGKLRFNVSSLPPFPQMAFFFGGGSWYLDLTGTHFQFCLDGLGKVLELLPSLPTGLRRLKGHSQCAVWLTHAQWAPGIVIDCTK